MVDSAVIRRRVGGGSEGGDGNGSGAGRRQVEEAREAVRAAVQG